MAFAPDGRLFVCEQGGTLRIIQNGQLLSTPFLTVPVDRSDERGLLGVAFDPDFPAEPFVYIYYTSPSPSSHNRLSRFTANGNVAVAGSEVVLIDFQNLRATNHNGGAIHFGPDGKLYVAVGDNGDSFGNPQSLNTLLGKMLRVNRDGTIPEDNPFYETAQGANRAIWALGLRNPFTFAFQPGTGRMFINDVGQASFEEINEGVAGSNYGWPDEEGYSNDPRYRSPLYAYDSSGDDGCAITGGDFYNPPSPQFPSSYQGRYFFADYCGNWIRTYQPGSSSAQDFATGVGAPVDLHVATDGSLYYLSRSSGAVRRIFYGSTESPPSIVSHPSNVTIAAGQSATFSVNAAGSAPLSYQWQRNGVNIPSATGANYTLASAQASDNGATFRVRVSNGQGNVLSNSATLTVLNNAAPVARILSPASGTLYSAGQSIQFSGQGTDAEDGTLPASAMTWQVDFHHDQHTHPAMPATSGATSGSYNVPAEGHTETNVWYRIHLSVRDSRGLTSSTFVDVRPRTATVSLATSPSGLRLTLDGQPVTAPTSFLGVAGVRRTLGTTTLQTLNGVNYEFESWSDGGAINHAVSTPSSNTTYTARFRVASGGSVRAEYFNNMDLSGTPLVRNESKLEFNWGTGSPSPALRTDGFSARFTGQVMPQYSQPYTFIVQSDDGVRLWVNGQLLIDNWTNHPATENRGSISLTAGQPASIRVEYFEHTGEARLNLSWFSPSQTWEMIPAGDWRPPVEDGSGLGLWADYFSGGDFGSYLFTRADARVDFDWGVGTPDPRVPMNSFSVRWTGELSPRHNETYTLYTQTDDGVRLWVDNELVIDDWTNHPVTERQFSLPLTAGRRYRIRMDYREVGGLASAKLLWSSPSQAKQVIPQTRLYPVRPYRVGVQVTSVSSSKLYRVAVAAPGASLYRDRTYTISTLSAGLLGGTLIQAANDDRYLSSPNHLRLSIEKPSIVYVAYDPRASELPPWLSDGSWTLTGESLTGTDFGGSVLRRSVWAKEVTAGPLVLGGNLADGADTHYIVVVQPQ